MPLAERLTTEGLKRGYSGTAKTIKLMHKLAAKGKLDPSMHEIATLIRLSVPEDRHGSTKATADAIFRWVKKHGIFQRDPFQIERIDHPVSAMKSIIEARQSGAYTGPGLFVGDCDTFSVWTATLGGLLGFNYAFETAKCDPVRPEEFSHVWTALRVGNDWVAYDASTPRAYPGWRPPMSSPDQFQRWPEQVIEDVMGMGEEFLPMDYFGNGVPKDLDWRPPEISETDPGQLELLIPEDTGTPPGEIENGVETVAKERLPGADFRPSLTQGDEVFDTGPRYSEGPKYYEEARGPYPVGSKWNRIQRDFSDKSMVPKGSEFHIAPSTVPARDVDVVDGVTVPVSELREENMGSIASNVLRRARGRVIMRPRRVAGMGDDAGAEPGGEQYAKEQAAVAADSSTSVWGDVTKAIASVAGSASQVAQTAITAKYQEALAKATARLTGGAVTPARTIQTIKAAGPWYMQPWVWLGGVVVLGGVGFIALSGRKGGRRRRR